MLLFYYGSTFCKCRKWIPLESALSLQKCIPSLIGYINLHKCHHLSSVTAEWRCICPVSHILARSCDYSLSCICHEAIHQDYGKLCSQNIPEKPYACRVITLPQKVPVPVAKPWRQDSTATHRGSCAFHVGLFPCRSLCLCLQPAG